MRAGMAVEFIEAPDELQARFSAGEITIPPSHIAACDRLIETTENITNPQSSHVTSFSFESGTFSEYAREEESSTEDYTGCLQPGDVKLTPDMQGFYALCNSAIKYFAYTTRNTITIGMKFHF